MYATTKMVKSADSVRIREIIPTVPLSGSCHSRSIAAADAGRFVLIDAIVIVPLRLFVLPIGVLRVLQIPQGPAAAIHRELFEVVFRRWRTGGPRQRPAVPGLVSGFFARTKGVNNIHDKGKNGEGLDDNP